MFCFCSGLTDGNVNRLLQGHTDIPLNETGRVQAGLAGDKLKEEKYDLVYSSDLSRAFETCSIVLAKNRSPADFVVRKDRLIRERCFGIYDGRPFEEYTEAADKAGLVAFRSVSLEKLRVFLVLKRCFAVLSGRF